MKKCYFSRSHTIFGRATLIVCSALGVGLIALICAAWNEIGTIHERILFCVIFGTGLLCIFYAVTYFLFSSREYALSEQGITIRYAGRRSVFYSWSCIRLICVCTVNRSSVIEGKGERVIWCTAGKIRKAPPDPVSRRWNTEEYLYLHYRSILTMEYSPERLEEFRKYSGREIPDYRDI